LIQAVDGWSALGSRRARFKTEGALGVLLLWVRLALSKPLGVLGVLLVLLPVSLAILAPLISPYDPYHQSADLVLKPPSAQHPFGTDNFGRDLLSRVIWGAQISLKVGVAAVGLGTLMGTVFGVLSGYIGGKVDMVIQRVADAWMAFPNIILALVILSVIGAGELNVMLAIGLSQIPSTNRIVRGAVLSEKSSLYLEAGRVVGCSGLRLMTRHLLPNIVAPIVVVATITLGDAILAEAALSFLGVGVQPPNPAWGSMLSGDSRTYFLVAPWMGIFPGLAIFLTVMGWNLFGDALRDILDPRLRGEVIKRPN
jgi:peptide/nickel transport system permease protein